MTSKVGLPRAEMLEAAAQYGVMENPRQQRPFPLSVYVADEVVYDPHALVLIDASPLSRMIGAGGLVAQDARDALGRAGRMPWECAWVEFDVMTNGSFENPMRDAALVRDAGDGVIVATLFARPWPGLPPVAWAGLRVTLPSSAQFEGEQAKASAWEGNEGANVWSVASWSLTPVGVGFLERWIASGDAAKSPHASGVLAGRRSYASLSKADRFQVEGAYAMSYMEPVWAAIGLPLCGNVRLEASPEDQVVGRVGGRKSRRKRRPALHLRTLVIGKHNAREVMEREARAASGEGRALHMRRGHLKTYSEERPLFGRYAGEWFWSPHFAGSAEHGEVVKGYEVVA